MFEITTVGLDLAKNVFQAHGADVSGRAVLRKKPRSEEHAPHIEGSPGVPPCAPCKLVGPSNPLGARSVVLECLRQGCR